MTSSTVNCPLCHQPAFSSLAALSMSLINVTTRSLDCPLCNESLSGLDKFTIHVFGHALSHKSQQNGVFKVIAGTFSQNAASFDVGLPVLISHIDAIPDENHVLKQGSSNLDESRLYISSDGDASPTTDGNHGLKQGLSNLDESRLYISSSEGDKNNNNDGEREAKNIDDRMKNISPQCESHNITSITSNHGSQTSINRDSNTSNNCKKSFSINDAGLISINQDSNLSNSIMENIGSNHVSNIECIVTRMDSNIGTNLVINTEGIETKMDSNIGTNNDNNTSSNSVECITTEIECQRGTNHQHNIKGIVTDIDGHIGAYHDGDETINGSSLKYYSNGEECSTFTTNYCDNNVKGGYKNSINSNGTPYYRDQVTREEHVDVDNDYNSSSIKDTDVPASLSDRLNSSTISKYSEDNSNDLLKNLEPFIKYGTPKLGKIKRNQIRVKGESDDKSIEDRRGIEDATNFEGIEEDSSNVKGDFTNLVGHTTNFMEINSNFIENRSNFMDHSKNNMENDSNVIEDFPNLLQTCGNAKGDSSYVPKVLKINGVTCGLEGSNTSVEATSSNLTSSLHHNISVEDVVRPYEIVPSSDTSSIHYNIVANDIKNEHYQVIPLLFESNSICSLQNDTPPSKTKTSKKDVKGLKRKFSKKSTDSSMTTQGVQTMEESFTKNNNIFGKFSIIDKMSEEPVQDSDMDERNVLCDGRNFVSDERNIVSEGRNIVSDNRSIVSDRRNTVSKGERFVSDCKNCDVTFENCTNSTENNVAAVCDLCLFTFPDEKILQMHKKLVHSDFDELKKSFSCHLCSKSFNMRGSLMVHRRVAHPILSGGQVSLKNIERIKEMKASTSSDETTPQFCCKTCGKSFKKEQHLTQHERTHEVKQWECDICSKVFSTKYFLKKHKRLHTGEMPYTCATCGKSFTFQQSYHKHLLYHSDEKPHVCAECGRAFKELSTLHNHQRIHTGEKPFACETCGKCFRQRVSYLVHRRIHTGVMPYKCTICNKSFRYKVSERTHKCNNATQGQVVARINMVVEKLQKLEEKNTISNQESLSSITCSSEATPPNTATTNPIAAKPGSQQHLNHSAHFDKPNSLEISDCPGFWTNISPSSTNHQPTNDSNIFSAENSDDFLSFVLTPTFSPSEQFRNLTLSPNSAQNREREMDETRNAEEGTMSNSVDRYHGNSFETINEQSLRDLLDNVDVL